MTIHQERTHPTFVEGCFVCKVSTLSLQSEGLKRERYGTDVTGGTGTDAYVRRMYAQARAAGKPDPVPENASAARFAPAAGVVRSKKYKEVNGGL